MALPVGRDKLRAGLERFGLLYRSSGDGKVISLDGGYGSAFTGAMAVALLAELQYYQATADGRVGRLRAAWLKGLMSLRIPGRGFRISPGFIDDTPFFDGEAWLALAYYNDVFPRDDGIASTLENLDGYLMTRYANDVSTSFYQWGTMAAALRFDISRSASAGPMALRQERIGPPDPAMTRGRRELTAWASAAAAPAGTILRAPG